MRSLLCLLASGVLCLTVGVISAADTWRDERQLGVFLCHADFSLENHLGLLDELQELQAVLSARLGVGPSAEPVHLFLFGSKSSYQRYLNSHFPQAPARPAVFIKQNGPGMVFAHLYSDFEVDVRHESTHALLHASLPVVPLWLDEGFAEYFEVLSNQRYGGNPHLAEIRRNLRFGILPRIENLEQIRDASRMGASDYRDAWALVHFMMHGPPEAREVLTTYLANLQNRSPAGQLSALLRQKMPDLQNQLAAHFNQINNQDIPGRIRPFDSASRTFFGNFRNR